MSEDQVTDRLRVIELQNALLTQEVRQLHTEVDKLSGGIGRGLWILGGGFLASAVAWVINGGLIK